MAISENRKRTIDNLVDELKQECGVVSFSSLKDAAEKRGVFVYTDWEIFPLILWKKNNSDKFILGISSTKPPNLKLMYLADELGYVLLNRSFDMFSFANQTKERRREQVEELDYFHERLIGKLNIGIANYVIGALLFQPLFLRHPLATIEYFVSKRTPATYSNSLYRRALAAEQKKMGTNARQQ